MKQRMRKVALGALATLAIAVVAFASRTPANTNAADPWSSLRLNGAVEMEHFTDPLQMRDASDLVIVGKFTGFTPGRTHTIPNALGPGQDDVLHWINGSFKIDEVITAAAASVAYAPGQTLNVEFFVGGAEEAPYLADDVARLRTGLTEAIGRAVLFLRAPGSALGPQPLDPCVDWPVEELEAFGMTPQTCDAQAIRASLGLTSASKAASTTSAGLQLVWSYGLVASTANAPVDVPLGEVPEEHEEPATIAASVNEWASLDEFIAYLRNS